MGNRTEGLEHKGQGLCDTTRLKRRVTQPDSQTEQPDTKVKDQRSNTSEAQDSNRTMANVVVQQPKKLSDWDSGLLSCCDDKKYCCYAFWCCPCFACNTAGKFGENHCLPLMDICSPAILTACGIPLFAPPASIALRAAIRHRYGIKGSLCKDICVSCFCVWCSWCQMGRELKMRRKQPVVVNLQPQNPPLNYQPPPGPSATAPAPGFMPMAPGYGAPPPGTYPQVVPGYKP